ncbi:hypothetical protein FQA39_LY10676 [Lamprigera yunnana]|nr:hypothetical protein FQA39_LY10676 [Lamprigera yunnana]
MSFARYSDTKCLTTREIEDILEDPAFWEDMNNNDVDADEIQIVIVPPEPDELTDIKNFEEDNLENEEEVKDIAGTLEVFVPTIDDEFQLRQVERMCRMTLSARENPLPQCGQVGCIAKTSNEKLQFQPG